MGWCSNFKKVAKEKDIIKIIDRWRSGFYGDYKWNKIEKGWYIMDDYANNELNCIDKPISFIPLKYCPYCGSTLIMDDI